MNIRHVYSVYHRLFWRSDTDILHLMLATASLLWAVTLVAENPPINTPVFRLMWAAGPAWVWAIFFAVHPILLSFCLFWKQDAKRCKQFTQFYGGLLWVSVTALMNFSIGRFTPSSALEVVTCGFVVWSIFRAGVKFE